MDEFRADLHCHTTCSDGTVSPQEIVRLAVKVGLQGLAITDHDTIDAYSEAMPEAENLRLSLISGVEFSAIHRLISVHILAYSFSLNSSIIQALCQKHYQRRLERNQLILERLAVYGMPLTNEDIAAAYHWLFQHDDKKYHKRPVGRPHIAVAMFNKGYVQSIQQAFHDYIGEGKPCYVVGNPTTVEETLALIHQARGLSIIAHPHLIENGAVLQDLLEMPFDGIEGYYARFSSHHHERWIQIGLRKGWIITGGSDFHGDLKPHLALGSSWVNEETFHLLLNRFQQNQLSNG
jgi:3',5'-nucleoside bisphosphate phosphatase